MFFVQFGVKSVNDMEDLVTIYSEVDSSNQVMYYITFKHTNCQFTMFKLVLCFIVFAVAYVQIFDSLLISSDTSSISFQNFC